jgi:hypothetical protein
LRKVFLQIFSTNDNRLSESIAVWIHSGGVLINKECVADHDVNSSIVH